MDLLPAGARPTVDAMKGYGQFCPIAVASEIVTERWTLLILRELLGGSRRFGQICQGVPLISRTLLVQRLNHLEEAGLIESRPAVGTRGREYVPTAAAEEFRDVLNTLGAWGQRWARATQFDRENLDLGVLMWNMHRRVDSRRLPARRVVVRFDFRAYPERCRAYRTCWLLLDRNATEVCIIDPMLKVDVVVAADAATMARVWMGSATFEQAIRAGGLRISGPRDLVRDLPGWFLLSPFASTESRKAAAT